MSKGLGPLLVQVFKQFLCMLYVSGVVRHVQFRAPSYPNNMFDMRRTTYSCMKFSLVVKDLCPESPVVLKTELRF